MTRWAALAVALALAASAEAQDSRIEGTVADAETAEPVAGASVLATAGGWRGGRATGADGRFVLDGVPTGRVALRVTAVGYAPLDTALVVAGPTTLALRLRPATTTATEVVVQARRSATATRADAPVLLVPQAVSVLPAGVLDAQAARDLPDALRNVPGVSMRGVGEPGALPVLRGFRTDQTGGGVRRNGVEVPYLADGLRANVARVEVLRGPASVLYGRLEPGGVVNVITEVPQLRRHAEVAASGGTLGGGRLAVDVGGPVGAAATRLNASAEREAWGRGEAVRSALFVAPAARWRPSGRWVLDFDAEAVASETTIDPGLAALGTDTDALDDTPRDRFFGEPTAVHRWRSVGVFGTSAWAAAPRADVRSTVSLARYDLGRDALDLDSLVTVGAPAVARSLRREGLGFTYLKGATFADLRLETGPVAHTVTVGAEAIRAWAQADGTAPLPATAGGLRFGLVDPVALDAPRPTGLNADEVDYLDATVRGLDAGVFVQDRATVRLGRATVHAVAAARLSHVRFGATIRALADTPDAPAGIGERSAQVTAVTPSAGLVVEPRPGLALYVSSGTSFNPIVERVDRNGEPFRPTRGVQVEGGAKLDARWLAASAAAFWIRKDDALTVGPGGFSDQTGRQRSRGVEVEARAQGAGLVGLATYTLLDAEVIEDDNVPAGTPLAYAPRHAASAWVEARRGALAVRGGVWAQGARTGSLGSTLVLPAEAVVDVGAEVAVRRGVVVRVDVRNALDARGYTGGLTRRGRPGEPLLVAWLTPPREIRLGVTARW
ncbi:TonB-dependent receptor domain-containing protein [Rubrivirga sp.]|uniref:TonB-dependent receptor domain-containing protein n=1 Tax=Rubrivirga sp. TaxID=1885344 RepID=UPI003B51F1AB